MLSIWVWPFGKLGILVASMKSVYKVTAFTILFLKREPQMILRCTMHDVKNGSIASSCSENEMPNPVGSMRKLVPIMSTGANRAHSG